MDKVTRTDLFAHDMVHDNPGLVKYESKYNDSAFLKERGYDGKTFDLYNCAQYGLLWDNLEKKYGRPKIFAENSEERNWVLRRREELRKLYQEMADAGLEVTFMMDIIVLPNTLVERYPEVLNADGKIDIMNPMTAEIFEEMFEEMFQVFPQINGIYIRYGETYTGTKFGLPCHRENNPIIGNAEEYHIRLINYLKDIVCNKHQRDIYYRSWGFGEFQYNRETYLRVSDQIAPHPRFYFCIKHTSGDFHRCFKFNQSLNCGKHKQIVEVQAAREYEGKGAYPNYIADGVINGFEEYKWLMPEEENKSLRDVINVKDSLVCGLWTWSRGGGWDGPYVNGRNGKDGEVILKDGSELWCDLNAYVLSHWAKDTGKSDRFYAMQYAKDILHLSNADCHFFYEICILSARAVLLGRGTNTGKMPWNVWWTRDQNINQAAFEENVKKAVECDAEDILLWEKRRSVELWEEIVSLAERISTGESREYIVTTCQYGYYLYAIYESMYRANIYTLIGEAEKAITAKENYNKLWKGWMELKEKNTCCPTLYAKEDEIQRLIGYEGNKGFDSVMNGVGREENL